MSPKKSKDEEEKKPPAKATSPVTRRSNAGHGYNNGDGVQPFVNGAASFSLGSGPTFSSSSGGTSILASSAGRNFSTNGRSVMKIAPGAVSSLESDQKSPFAFSPKKKIAAGGLTAFGITASASPAAVSRRTGVVQFAVIGGPNPVIFVKFSPNGFWGEKKMFDALRERQEWLMVLEPCQQVFNYHQNNVPIRNSRGYSVRLFAFFCGTVPENQNLIEMGKYLCENVNNMEGNNTVAVIQRDNLYFANNDVTWSEICGTQTAYEQLLLQASEEASPGFYDRHQALVHHFFRQGTFLPEFARVIDAPNHEILPSRRAEIDPLQVEPPQAADNDAQNMDAVQHLDDLDFDVSNDIRVEDVEGDDEDDDDAEG